MKRNVYLRTAISILLIVFCFLFPHYSGFPIFIYPIIVLTIIWIFLNFFYKESFSDLSFSFRRFKVNAIWVGAIAAVLLSCFFRFAWTPVIDKILPGEKIDYSAFAAIRGNTFNYVFILLIALVVGGFYEEIIFHGFNFTRLEKIFRGKYSVQASVVLSNLIFGLYHYQMGVKEVLLATIAGFAYQALILKFNRNLWYGLFFHAFFDFIGLTLIYLGKIS